MNSPIRGYEKRTHELETVLPPFEKTKSENGNEKVCAGGEKRGESGRCARDDQDRSNDWAENNEEEHYWKMNKLKSCLPTKHTKRRENVQSWRSAGFILVNQFCLLFFSCHLACFVG